MIPVHISKSFIITIALSLAIAELLIIPSPNLMSIAATPKLRSTSQKRPAVPPASGRPKRSASGGSRSQCPQVKIGATAIVPLTEANTLSDRPTFWVYSPYSGPNRSAKLVLEQAGEHITTKPILITLPTTPGLFKIQLPDTISLKPDQSYQWFFTIDCSSDQPQAKTPPQPPIELKGSVRRITLTPSDRQKLAALAQNSREQFDFYVAKNLWLEAIETTLDRRQATPNYSDLKLQWETVLQLLELQELRDYL